MLPGSGEKKSVVENKCLNFCEILQFSLENSYEEVLYQID